MAGVFRRGYATLSTRGSLPLDETKPSVPWRAVRSHIVKKAGVLLQGQGARNGDYDMGIICAILWVGCISSREKHSFYTRIASSRRDEAISPLESSPLSHCKKSWCSPCHSLTTAGLGVGVLQRGARISKCQFVSVRSGFFRGRCTFVAGSCHSCFLLKLTFNNQF